MLVLDFLRSLPEEQIRADRRAEDRDDSRPEGRLARKSGNEQSASEFAERNLHEHERAEIGQKREGQPFQDGNVAGVLKEYLEAGADDRKEHDVDRRLAADEEADRIPHGPEIRADIDDVRDEQERDDARQQPGRVVFAKVGRAPAPGGASDPRADFLDRGHQRVAEEYRPDDAEPELGVGLGIGRNAARIVVGCAGDQAGTEHIQQARLRGADDRVRVLGIIDFGGHRLPSARFPATGGLSWICQGRRSC